MLFNGKKDSKKVYEVSASPKFIGKLVGIGAIVLVAIIIIASAVVIVPSGNTGVLLTFGKVSARTFDEGLHFKIPFAQDVVMVSNKIQKQDVSTQAVSKAALP